MYEHKIASLGALVKDKDIVMFYSKGDLDSTKKCIGLVFARAIVLFQSNVEEHENEKKHYSATGTKPIHMGVDMAPYVRNFKPDLMVFVINYISALFQSVVRRQRRFFLFSHFFFYDLVLYNSILSRLRTKQKTKR